MYHDAFQAELLDGLDDAAYCVDQTRRIVSWNKAAEALTGYSAAEAVGSRCWHNLLRHVDDNGRQLCRGWCPLVATMQDGVPREARVYLHHHDGHRVPVEIVTRPLRTNDGTIIGAVETFHAVVEPRAGEGHPDHHDEERDPTTGLDSLGTLHTRLERWLVAMRRGGCAFGVIRLRIDARARLSASFDTATCEAIIKAVGATIRHAIRAGDVAARSADEEFLILLPDCGTYEVATQVQRLRFLIEQTFLVKNRQLVRVNVAVGAAVCQPDDTVTTLLARAADEVLAGA